MAQGISIQSGTQLVATGAINLVIKDGNFTNNGAFVAGSSTVSFIGDSTYASAIAGTSTTSFQNMNINRTAGNVELQNTINILGDITMTNHNLLLGDYVADLGTTGSVINESETSKIISAVGTLNRTMDLNAPNAVNPGNIGVEITSASNLGTTLIKRYNEVVAVSAADNSINRFYDITPTNNNSLNATLTIHYFDSELGALSENSLNVWSSKNSGVSWKFYSKTSADQDANTVTKTNMDTLARVTLSSNNNNAVLAVKLFSFEAKQDGANVKLNWITSQEQNNDRFEIERSQDGNSFVLVGTVRSKGDNNGPQAYSFKDNHPENKSNYYRLKILDKDNTYEYSNIVVVTMNEAVVNTVSAFPLPVKNTVTVKIRSAEVVNSSVKLLNASGNIVYVGNWKLEKGMNTMQIPMAHFAAGNYYLHFTGIALDPLKLYKE